MERNESMADRIIRGVLGAALLATAVRPSRAGRVRPWQIVAGAAGLVLGITALTGTCGVYQVFGISTRRR
jgi:hypothetical protein